MSPGVLPLCLEGWGSGLNVHILGSAGRPYRGPDSAVEVGTFITEGISSKHKF